MNKFAISAGAAIAVASLSVAPAFAATISLPSNQTMFYVDCDSNNGQMWQVTDSATSAAKPVGTPLADLGSCGYSGGYDPTSGFGYYVDSTGAIVKFLPATGEQTLIPLSGDTDQAFQIAISEDGTALIENGRHFYSVDLTTGETVVLVNQPQTGGYLTYNSSTGEFLVFEASGFDYTVSTVDPSNGSTSQIGTLDHLDFPVQTNLCGDEDTGSGLDQVIIDGSGNYWLQMDGSLSDMVVYNPNTDEWSYNGQVHDETATIYATDNFCGTAGFYQMGMIITPLVTEPESLAETGISADAFAGGALVSAVLMATGVAIRRRRS